MSMQTIYAFSYNPAINTGTNTTNTVWRMAYQQPIMLYKGTANTIKIVVFNNAQKVVDLTDYDIQVQIVDQSTQEHFVTRTATVTTPTSGVASITFTEADLRNLEHRFYHIIARLMPPNDGSTVTEGEILYLDDNYGAFTPVTIEDAWNYNPTSISTVDGIPEISFTNIRETPDSFVGQANKYLRVNSGETAIEFVDIDWSAITNKPAIPNLLATGNIIPSANVTYSLGNVNYQWKDLWVSNNTIYLNSIPLSVDVNGNLLVNGNVITAGLEFPLNAGQPALNPPSGASKNELITLYDFDNIANGQVNYGIGVENNYLWNAVDSNVAGFKWYAGENRVFTINGNGTVTFADSSIQETAYRFTASSTEPTKTTGAQWFNTNDGRLYINYNNTWVDASPTELDPNAIRFNEQNQIELPENGDIVDINGVSVLTDLGNWLFNNNNLSNSGAGNAVIQASTFSGAALVIKTGSNVNATKDWTFRQDGNLRLPAGGDIQRSDGTSVFKTNLSQFTNDLTIDADTLSGTTLADNVTASSLTSVGILAGLTSSGVIHITNTEDSTNADTGSLQVDGGAHITKNLIAEGTVYAGVDAFTEALTNPLIVASSPSGVQGGYSQVAILNNTAEASGDFQVMVDGYDVNVSDTGWADLGMAGSNFSDGRYTITQPGDGYVFVSGKEGSSNGGSLVLATDGSGTTNDIVFATGGFLTANEKMRLTDADGKLHIDSGALTSTSSMTLNSGSKTWTFGTDGSTTLGNGAKLDGGTPNKFATDNTVVEYVDLRDTSGRGFYTDNSGFTLRSNGTYNWIFDGNGVLNLPAGVGDIKKGGVSVLSGAYTLPTATSSVLGGVKIDGTTIVIDGNGVISATGAGGGGYSLPTASNSTLGGVKIDGTTININGSGVISAVIPANISAFTNDAGYLTSVTNISGNAATATKLATARNINGVAFDGTGDITVTAAAGTLTGNTLNAGVTQSSLTSVGTLTNLTVTNPIAGSVTGSAGSVSGTNLTGTTLASNIVTSSLTSVGTLTNLTVTNPIAGTVQNGVVTTGSYADPAWITSLAYSKLTGAPTLATVATSGSYNDLLNAPAAYTLPTASGSTLGGIKIGTGLNIDGSGIVTASSLVNGSNVLKLVSAPASLLGASGDTAGSIAIDGGYIYYCTRNYTGLPYTYTVTTNATTASMNSYLPPANTVIGTLVYIQGPLPIQPQTTWTLTYNGVTYTIGAVGNPNNGAFTQVYLTNSGVNIPANSTVTLNAPASSNIWTRTPWNATDRYGISVSTGSASGGGALTYNPINGIFTFQPAVTQNPSFTQGITISGNVTSSQWGTTGIGLKISSATYTDTSSNISATNAMFHVINAPTLNAVNPTNYTNSATLYIAGAPVAGTNAGFTNRYALLAASGDIGLTTGQLLTPARHAFRVYGSGTTSSLSTTQNGDGKLTSANFATDYTQGSGFAASTGIFTAPVAGLYQVNLTARTSGSVASSNQIAVVKNYAGSSSVACMIEFGASSSMIHTGASSIVKLAANDTLVVKVLAGTVNFDSNNSWSVAFLG